MSPPRVAMVCSRYPPHLGGVETHVNEVARRIAATGLDLTVLTTDLTGELPTIEQRGKAHRSTVSCLAHAGPISTYRRHWSAKSAEGSYDLVHVQGVNNFLPPMALASAQRTGIPLWSHFTPEVTPVVCGHDQGARSGRLCGLFYATRRALIAVCRYEVERFFPRPTWRCTRDDPAHQKRFGTPSRRGDEPEVSGSPLVCSVGRLERYKGHQRVIAAMPALLRIGAGSPSGSDRSRQL